MVMKSQINLKTYTLFNLIYIFYIIIEANISLEIIYYFDIS